MVARPKPCHNEWASICCGGGGGKIGKFMKQKKPKSTLLVVDNNKTNKTQASRFCSTTSHYSKKRG